MMKFEIVFTDISGDQFDELKVSNDKKAIFKAVNKILGYMETNIRHPSLNTHKYSKISGPKGEDVFESYAQNRTPGAYRVFWYYGPKTGFITILDISPHP